MQGEPGKPDHRGELAGSEPVFMLVMASIVGAVFWNVFTAGQCGGIMGLLFALVFGLWYFLGTLVFFMMTKGRWKWETAAFVIIGIVCYYQLYWSQVTPEYLGSDAQAGLFSCSAPFGPGWRRLRVMPGWFFFPSLSVPS